MIMTPIKLGLVIGGGVIAIAGTTYGVAKYVIKRQKQRQNGAPSMPNVRVEQPMQPAQATG
jgi:hypothetical protein